MVLYQPRSQGLLGFQYGGGSREDPGTQWTKKIADWFFSHMNSDWFNVERKMAASEESRTFTFWFILASHNCNSLTRVLLLLTGESVV